MGASGTNMRMMVDSPGGWGTTLGLYADYLGKDAL